MHPAGDNRVDSTYVDNAAQAHLLALEKIGPTAACAGKAYFISNGEPLAMRELLNAILAAAQLPPVDRRVSPRLAYAVGSMLEMVYRVCGLQNEPIMTRFVARQLSTHHWFCLDAARRDLGYQADVSLAAGFERLRESLVR